MTLHTPKKFLAGESDDFSLKIGDFTVNVDASEHIREGGGVIYVVINHAQGKADMPATAKTLGIIKSVGRFGKACAPLFEPAPQKTEFDDHRDGDAPYFEITFEPADGASWKRADIHDYVKNLLTRGHGIYEKFKDEKTEERVEAIESVLKRYDGQTLTTQVRDQITASLLTQLYPPKGKS